MEPLEPHMSDKPGAQIDAKITALESAIDTQGVTINRAASPLEKRIEKLEDSVSRLRVAIIIFIPGVFVALYALIVWKLH
jgi:hypothetical protein